MNASIEISLYPLSEDYKVRITEFILRLKEEKNIRVETNGMSTQLFGDYDVLMDLMKEELRTEFQKHRCMAVMKIGDGMMGREKLPEELR